MKAGLVLAVLGASALGHADRVNTFVDIPGWRISTSENGAVELPHRQHVGW